MAGYICEKVESELQTLGFRPEEFAEPLEFADTVYVQVGGRTVRFDGSVVNRYANCRFTASLHECKGDSGLSMYILILYRGGFYDGASSSADPGADLLAPLRQRLKADKLLEGGELRAARC